MNLILAFYCFYIRTKSEKFLVFYAHPFRTDGNISDGYLSDYFYYYYCYCSKVSYRKDIVEHFSMSLYFTLVSRALLRNRTKFVEENFLTALRYEQ